MNMFMQGKNGTDREEKKRLLVNTITRFLFRYQSTLQPPFHQGHGRSEDSPFVASLFPRIILP